jgi:hypothetical protein
MMGQQVKKRKEEDKQLKADQQAAENILTQMVQQSMDDEERLNAAQMAFMQGAATASSDLRRQSPFLLQQATALPQAEADIEATLGQAEASRAAASASRAATQTEVETRPATVRRAESDAKLAEVKLDTFLRTDTRIQQLRDKSPEIDELFTFFDAGAGGIKLEELRQQNALQLEKLKQEQEVATGSTQSDIARRMLVGEFFDIAIREHASRLSRRETEIANAQHLSGGNEKELKRRLERIDELFPAPNIGEVFNAARAQLQLQGIDISVGDLRNYTHALGFTGGGENAAIATPQPTVAPADRAALNQILSSHGGDVTKALQFLKDKGASAAELTAARNFYQGRG